MEFITTSALEDVVYDAKSYADTPIASGYTVYGSDDFEWTFRTDSFDQYTAEDLVDAGEEDCIDPNGTDDTRYVLVSDVVERCEESVEFDSQEVIYTRDIYDIYDENTDECDSAFVEYGYDMGYFTTPSEAISASVSAYVDQVQREGIERAVSELQDLIA